MHPNRLPILAAAALGLLPLAGAADAKPFERMEDVIYGRKYGTALTLDVFTPKEPSGAAIIFVVSGGWFSSHDHINAGMIGEFLSRGYTVFAVVHGSQPKFAIPEVIADMHRSVRFIRHEAAHFRIDPDRIGITGGSAGGHLSLMIGAAGGPGSPDAKDPVDRESSRVRAVACFFPPTDFMNYRDEGRDVFAALEEELAAFRAPFDFTEPDPKTNRIVLIQDMERRRRIAREISPVTHASADDPPMLIIHGDADKLVPIQQAQAMEKKLLEAGARVKLVTKPGAGHGWPDMLKDLAVFADWFDEHLRKADAKR